jgi:cyanophycinase-like exopeptidase
MGNDSTITQAVRKAEAIFFTGGNQDNYNTWIKGTAVGKAVLDAVKIRHVPVGGTSAGDAIMGWVYYSAHTSSLAGSDGLADPYVSNSDIMYNDFLKNAFLQNTICEPHFLTRGRQGRLMSFMARMNKDQGISPVKALASDESSAICIDSNGIGMAVGTGRVHFIRQWCAAPETCVSGSPLLWKNGVEVYSIIAGDNTTLPSAGMAFNLKTWTVTGGSFTHEWWTISPAGTINIGQTTATPAICNPTGLSEVNVSEAEFSAYQSGRSIVLKAANLTSGNDCIIDLYDITGKQIANLKIAPGETSFETSMDVNGLPSGIYLIIIRN